MKYVQVIVDIAHSNVDKIFDYALGDIADVPAGCRVAVPFGSMVVEGFVLGCSDETQMDAAKIKRVARVIDDEPIITADQIALAKYMVARYATTLTFALRLMFPAKLRGERIREKTIRIISLVDEDIAKEELAKCYTKNGLPRAKNRIVTIEKLLAERRCPAAALDPVSIRYLIEKGAAAETHEESLRRPYKGTVPEKKRIEFTGEQSVAIEKISGFVAGGEKKTVVLHGVTGSGKTEVYIECIRRTIEMGKSALVLVPEISLAPQLYGELTRAFGEAIAVFHSALSDGERYDEWRRVKSGRARIALGARSAVFLPLADLGLIIMDEEHAESYRADSHPPYHAQEIANMRIAMGGGTLVLASATPGVENYMKAKLGLYELIEMKKRVLGLALPKMTIVDMKKEYVKGNRSQISAELFHALEKTLAAGEQALLFLNRRGYASSVICPSCGAVRMCTHCDVPLKYHHADNTLLCHYCGRSVPFDRACPACGEPFTRLMGSGTEKLEEQVAKYFPQARVLRMDFDTTRRKDAHRQIYEQFKAHEADILIGTQMIARGLDFGAVTLAAIVYADSMLASLDYRAEERTYAMIEQVGGRAGRTAPGRVIVQTYNPDHYAITCAARHDYEGMFEREMAFRRAAMRPPFTRLFRMVFSHTNEERAKKICLEAENMLKEMLKPYLSDIILFTAKSAPVAKLDGRFRYHILIKTRHNAKTKDVRGAVSRVYEAVSGKSGVRVSFETDPYDIN